MRTITRLVDPQPHGAISECVSGEFAVVGFDVHQNVIDANITFHGNYVGDTVKFGDRYYIIREARVVAIKDEWWWILDVEEDIWGKEKCIFEKTWHLLGKEIISGVGFFNNLLFLSDKSLVSQYKIDSRIKSLADQLSANNPDYKTTLLHIALFTAILYNYEETPA